MLISHFGNPEKPTDLHRFSICVFVKTQIRRSTQAHPCYLCIPPSALQPPPIYLLSFSISVSLDFSIRFLLLRFSNKQEIFFVYSCSKIFVIRSVCVSEFCFIYKNRSIGMGHVAEKPNLTERANNTCKLINNKMFGNSIRLIITLK